VSTTLDARFFDGRSSRPHAATLRVDGDLLTVAPAAGESFAPLAVPLAELRWPERTRHGGRIAQLPQGASVQALDATAWDAWAAHHGRRESWVVRAQQNWRAVVLAVVLLLAAGAAMYQWGVPWVARGVTALIPQRVDMLVGAQVLASIDDSLLQPSALPAEDQARVRRAFARMVQAAYPDDAPPWKLEFRRGKDERLGPNALALPGGTIVLTDALVQLMPGNDDAVLGVLGHEFGHVRRRHAMRQLVQASAVGLGASIAFGDYGTLIGSAPVLLATLGYSRDAEREADAESVRLMRAAGIPPLTMVDFFEAVEQWRAGRTRSGRDDGVIGIAFSSHPATAERIAFFRQAARN
jgi:Zn-dependent protease with chaperone function